MLRVQDDRCVKLIISRKLLAARPSPCAPPSSPTPQPLAQPNGPPPRPARPKVSPAQHPIPKIRFHSESLVKTFAQHFRSTLSVKTFLAPKPLTIFRAHVRRPIQPPAQQLKNLVQKGKLSKLSLKSFRSKLSLKTYWHPNP